MGWIARVGIGFLALLALSSDGLQTFPSTGQISTMAQRGKKEDSFPSAQEALQAKGALGLEEQSPISWDAQPKSVWKDLLVAACVLSILAYRGQ